MENIISLFDTELIIRFTITIVSLFILLRIIYYRHTPNREMLFGFFVFGCGVFLVTSLLHNVEISMGFAFGLFAIFSMLRYRTESISIRDMTYLFVVIVISLMSSVGPIVIEELAIVNSIMCVLTAVAETQLFAPKISEKKIVYEKIENIHPNRQQNMIKDLNSRTGLNIINVKIGNINFSRGTAELFIYYKDNVKFKQEMVESPQHEQITLLRDRV